MNDDDDYARQTESRFSVCRTSQEFIETLRPERVGDISEWCGTFGKRNVIQEIAFQDRKRQVDVRLGLEGVVVGVEIRCDTTIAG